MSEKIDSDSNETITVDTTFLKYQVLPKKDQKNLVRKLNSCNYIKNNKQGVINKLLPALQERIEEKKDLFSWTDALLVKCDDIKGGFQSLLKAISFFDEETNSYKELISFCGQITLGEKPITYKKNITNSPINESPTPEIPLIAIQPISKTLLTDIQGIFDKYTKVREAHVKSERMLRTITELRCLLDQIKELFETDQKNKIRRARTKYRCEAAKINDNLPSLNLGSNDTICQNDQLESILPRIGEFVSLEIHRKLSTDDNIIGQELEDMEGNWLQVMVDAQKMAIIYGNMVNECQVDFTQLLSQIISS